MCRCSGSILCEECSNPSIHRNHYLLKPGDLFYYKKEYYEVSADGIWLVQGTGLAVKDIDINQVHMIRKDGKPC